MTLYEMLDKTVCYGSVLIYERNDWDECVRVFGGYVEEARKDIEVWLILMSEVDQWICGNGVTLIFVHTDERYGRNSQSWEDVYERMKGIGEVNE